MPWTLLPHPTPNSLFLTWHLPGVKYGHFYLQKNLEGDLLGHIEALNDISSPLVKKNNEH